ncbi:MAG TPA: hypothetical protein VGM41_03820 [Chitinophagaceae bacterium]|jgi:hypothetical protein
MKKRLLFFLLATGLITEGWGQVLITLQLPPAGATIKSQLWNFSLLNASGSAMDVQVTLTLTDVAANQLVFTGTSKLFSLPRGIKQVQAADVTPVTYNINNSGYGVDASPDGFLPVGMFNACYTVVRVNSDLTEQLAEECATIEIEPISPPMLLMPEDSANTDVTRPFFTWLPPAPYNLFNAARYDWLLVEVMPTQTAATAVQENIPLLSQSSLTTNTFQYPLAMAELDTGKLYAWQVTAKNNLSPVAKSEIWSFRVLKYSVDSIVHVAGRVYTPLRRYNDGSCIISTGAFCFQYLNELNDPSAAVTLQDISSSRPQAITLDSVKQALHYGSNFVSMDFTGEHQLTNRHLYLFTLTNSKQETWYLKFEYRSE